MKALLKQAVVSLAACIALISSSVGNLTLSLGGGFSFKSRMHPANGSGANLHWLVNDEKIAPHILVIDKSKREDGSFSRDDFTFDKGRNTSVRQARSSRQPGRLVNEGETLLCIASTRDCRASPLKANWHPEDACSQDPARCGPELAKTEAFQQSSRDRKARPGMAFWNGQPCGAGSIAWMLPTPIDRELAQLSRWSRRCRPREFVRS